MKKVFVLILNWNGWQMTIKCLSSLAKIEKGNLNVEVLVIDNGSSDESLKKIGQYLLSHKKIRIRLIENKENLGFAEGNNVGIKYAMQNGADFVCLLNNDTRIAPDFLVNLVKAATSEKQSGLVGGKIFFEKGYEFHRTKYRRQDLGKVIWYAGGKIDWQNVYASHRGVDEVDQGQYETLTETDYVNGCLMLVKREVFEKIGLIDANYFLYLEDTDFSQRAKKAGFKLYYTPRAVIWHLNAGSSSAGSDLQDYYLTRNRLLFGLKWAPWRAKLALTKESLKLVFFGRKWQKIGVRDFYLGKLGQGSWR